jgi:hypothetical protein
MRERGVMVECQRCSNQQHEPRASRYPEDLFLENWHDLMDLQHEHKLLLLRCQKLQAQLTVAADDRDWWAEQARWNMEMWLKAMEPKPKKRSPFDEPIAA